MIKSPCKDCEKHETQFPICLNQCEIIKQVQKHDSHCVLDIRVHNEFNEFDTFGFNNNNNNKNKNPALS
jgi:hypothetical protein